MANMGPITPQLNKAVEDFREARRKAALESFMGILLRRRTDLLSYDLVRNKLRAIESSRRILGDIPLDKIVGSVNRYTDFSRSFLPRQESDRERWARVRLGVDTQKGLPPIEVYKVGEVYFILDGHHRVSVARDMGMSSIEGYIIPVQTRVPLLYEDSPDDLIVKAEYTDFLSKTRFDELRPDADLLVTAPGQYQKLTEHIRVHQYFLDQKRTEAVSEAEAIGDWYDTVYSPVINLIRSQNVLRDFPNRTETDLYLWIMDYRSQISGGGIGWEVSTEKAVIELSARFSPKNRIPRLVRRVRDRLIPEPFAPGPPPGAWHSHHPMSHRDNQLFDDLIVTLQSGDDGRAVMDMAIEVARREKARLTGLHAAFRGAEKTSPEVGHLQEEFMRRCEEAGVFGRALVEEGRASDLLCQHSPWVDLVLFTLKNPPPQKFFQRLRSGTRKLIRSCSTPLFAVPNAPFHLNSALLAYGPGRKAEEALFLAAYIANRWQIPLTVLTVKSPDARSNNQPSPLEHARAYLDENNIEANCVEEIGHSARSVLLNAEEHRADFIIMGGYESGSVYESVFGSTLDFVLRSTRRPVLICR
jgi:nucleotide-binding universal stress UspA family protein